MNDLTRFSFKLLNRKHQKKKKKEKKKKKKKILNKKYHNWILE